MSSNYQDFTKLHTYNINKNQQRLGSSARSKMEQFGGENAPTSSCQIFSDMSLGSRHKTFFI